MFNNGRWSEGQGLVVEMVRWSSSQWHETVPPKNRLNTLASVPCCRRSGNSRGRDNGHTQNYTYTCGILVPRWHTLPSCHMGSLHTYILYIHIYIYVPGLGRDAVMKILQEHFEWNRVNHTTNQTPKNTDNNFVCDGSTVAHIYCIVCIVGHTW